MCCPMDMPLKDVAERIEEAEGAAIVAVDTIGEVAGVITRTGMARAGRRCSPRMLSCILSRAGKADFSHLSSRAYLASPSFSW